MEPWNWYHLLYFLSHSLILRTLQRARWLLCDVAGSLPGRHVCTAERNTSEIGLGGEQCLPTAAGWCSALHKTCSAHLNNRPRRIHAAAATRLNIEVDVHLSVEQHALLIIFSIVSNSSKRKIAARVEVGGVNICT